MCIRDRTKNSLFDKDGAMQKMLASVLGNSFVFAQADKTWREKRKACAHAFYKQRMVHMLEILKDKMTEACEGLRREIPKA